jgi:tetratricopeptide (TPR) repeat protein
MLFVFCSCKDNKDAPMSSSNVLPPPQQKKYDPKVSKGGKQDTEIKRKKAESAKENLSKAKQFVQMKNYEDAFICLNKSLEESEESDNLLLDAYVFTGSLYTRFNDYQKAIETYQRYLSRSDGNNNVAILEAAADTCANLGMIYDVFSNSLANLHIDYYEYKLKLIKQITPDDISMINYFLGLEYYALNEIDKALESFKKVELIPYDNLAKIKIAGCYYKKGQKDKANKIWSGIKIGTNNMLAFSELWLTFLETGKFAESDMGLKQALIIRDWLGKPGNATDYSLYIRHNLAGIYCLSGEIDGSFEQFAGDDIKLPEIKLSNSRFFRSSNFRILAMAYLEKANEYYTECVQLDNQNADAYKYQLGWCLLRSSKLDESIAEFQSLSKGQYKIKSLIGIGVALYRKGEKDNAINILDKVVREKSDDKEILGELGYAYAKLGIALDRALEYANKSGNQVKIAFVHYQLAFTEKNQNQRILRLNEAISLLDKNRGTLGYYNNDPFLLVDLANAYYHKGFLGESATIWFHFVRRYQGIYHIIEVLRHIKEIQLMNPTELFVSNWNYNLD